MENTPKADLFCYWILELASKLETTTETVSETISETSFFREKNAKETKARTFVIPGLFQLLHQ
jgi:hypothetical protein